MSWLAASEVLYMDTNLNRQLGQGELQISDCGSGVSLTAI